MSTLWLIPLTILGLTLACISLACDGQLDLHIAQQEISTNCVAACIKDIGQP